MRRLAAIVAAVLGFLPTGCQEQVYACQSDANCIWLGIQGLCLPVGPASYCAFPEQMCNPGQFWAPDHTTGCCPSGWRWDVSAPMLIEFDCVNQSLVRSHLADGGTSSDLTTAAPADLGPMDMTPG